MLRMLARHLAERAACRAAPSAGRRMPISSAMTEITTSNSISANARRVVMGW